MVPSAAVCIFFSFVALFPQRQQKIGVCCRIFTTHAAGLKTIMLCFTITNFRKFEFYEGKRRCRPSPRRMRRLNKRNRIEEEDEVFPRVGVAPPVSSLPGKVHTHPLLPLYRISLELNKQPTIIQSQIALYLSLIHI